MSTIIPFGVCMSNSMSVNGIQYEIVQLLGKGKGGYSYLACTESGLKVVVKQIP